MTISLTPELEHLIASKVQSGQYDSPSDVIREGLLRLEKEESVPELRLEELKREIAVGVEQAENGRIKPFDADAIMHRVRQQIAEG